MRRTSIAAEAAMVASMGSCALWTKTAGAWLAVTSLMMATAHRRITTIALFILVLSRALTSRMVSIMAAAMTGRREPQMTLRTEFRTTTSSNIDATQRGQQRCRLPYLLPNPRMSRLSNLPNSQPHCRQRCHHTCLHQRRQQNQLPNQRQRRR